LALSLTASEIWPLFAEKRTFSLTASFQAKIWKCFPCTASPKFCTHRASTKRELLV